VSIGRRLIDLARSELNSLLDRAARADDDDDSGSPTDRLSDRELEEELERRRQAREEAEQAAHGTRRPGRATEEAPADGTDGAQGSNGARRRPEFRRATSDDGSAVRRAYAALEVPPGSNFETVRRAYRTMMRKYHPDLHTSTPEKQKAANEVTQKLTDSYKLLEKKLRR
jgi:DnaJ-domain-containing protein 1